MRASRIDLEPRHRDARGVEVEVLEPLHRVLERSSPVVVSRVRQERRRRGRRRHVAQLVRERRRLLNVACFRFSVCLEPFHYT